MEFSPRRTLSSIAFYRRKNAVRKDSDQHSGDEHGEGGVHVAQKLHRLGDESGQRDLEEVEDKAHDDGVDGRAAQQTSGHLFGIRAAADDAVAQRPEQKIEDGKVGAGVKQALGTK